MSSISEACLDHFAMRDLDDAKVIVLEHQEFSDHYPISLSFPIQQKLEEGFVIFTDSSFSEFFKLNDKFLFLLINESKNDKNNYHPIAILDGLGKVYERVMFNRV